jgi:serine/threonine-protein kinase
LWAAGVLGTLAIISAILIVLADRDKRNTPPVQTTVTDTVEPSAVDQSPPPATPSAWSGDTDSLPTFTVFTANRDISAWTPDQSDGMLQ